MTTVNPVRPTVPEQGAADPVVTDAPSTDAPSEAAAPRHAVRTTGPTPQRLLREKLAVLALMAAVLAVTLALLAMQWLSSAPTSGGTT